MICQSHTLYNPRGSIRSIRSIIRCVFLCCCQVTSVVANSMWPHRRQPTRLPHPWDSLGKNTGMGCHFLLQCMKVKSESEVAQSCPTPSNPMDCSLPGSSIHGIFQARVLDSAILPLRYWFYKTCTQVNKDTCTRMFTAVAHNSQELEATQMPIPRTTNKWIIEHS